MLRLEENCLELSSLTPKVLKESKISLLAVEGNVFDMKAFHDVDGYDEVSLLLFLQRDLNYIEFKPKEDLTSW